MNERSQKFKVTFVDDDPFLLTSIRRQLHDLEMDCQFCFFESAVEAWEDAQQSPPDMVFTDIQMPSMRGDEFLKLIKSKFPSTIRIVLSSTHEDTLSQYGDLIDQIVNKPATSANIATIIDQTINQCDDSN